MKKIIAPLMLAFLTAIPLASLAQASLESDPAYLPIDKVLDLKTIQPDVNVNLPRFLLKDVVAGLNNLGTNSPQLAGIDFADLIKDIKLIRVVIIPAKEANRPVLDKAMKALREKLAEKWTAIVTVPEDNVGVYAMSDAAGDSNTGLAVLVYDHDNAVIANIVGHVSISKLIQVASQSHKFPKDFLKNLQGLGNQPAEPAKSGDSSNNNAAGTEAKTPADASPAK